MSLVEQTGKHPCFFFALVSYKRLTLENSELSSTILPSSTDSHSPPREGRPSYVTTRLATPRHLTELHQLGLVCHAPSAHPTSVNLCCADQIDLPWSLLPPCPASPRQAGRFPRQTDRHVGDVIFVGPRNEGTFLGSWNTLHKDVFTA